jgi:hypothetical protein
MTVCVFFLKVNSEEQTQINVIMKLLAFTLQLLSPSSDFICTAFSEKNGIDVIIIQVDSIKIHTNHKNNTLHYINLLAPQFYI